MTVDALQFRGKFRFLSNFTSDPVIFDGETYPTVEHAYQAAKTLDIKEREYIKSLSLPGEAKKAGRRVTMREDWDDIKVNVMFDLIKQKFLDLKLKNKLLEIDGLIVEGNYWNDTFWGVCNGKGENILGKILMNLRDEFKKELTAV